MIEQQLKDDLRKLNDVEDNLHDCVDVLFQKVFFDLFWFVHVVEECRQEEEELVIKRMKSMLE